ncbi:MAG: hypothetical protein ACI8PZ_002784 [Myxococcota bacterium]|jgi:hypothetical protein
MESWWPWALVAVLLFAITLAWRRASTRTGRNNRRRQRVAQRGEVLAESLLAAAGFRVEDRQVTARWSMHIDGEPHEVHCRADLIVTRRRRRYVAEVKTGERAPDPTLPATRRQLLEYRLAFDVDGLLLVDVPGREVIEVEFPYPSS